MKCAALSLAFIAFAAGQARSQATPPQPAGHAANATVSPDGRRIAFFSDRDGTGEIYLMNADGSGVRRLTTDGGHRGRAYWSADGHRLAFALAAGDSTRILSVSVDSGAVAELGRVAARGATPFADASHVVYGVGAWTEMQLVTSRVDGSERVQLTSDRAAYWCAAVSPRNNQVAASRQDSSGMQIWIMKLDGSSSHQVTRFPKADGRPQCASFSPDGGRIAVQSEVPDPKDPKRMIGHIWVVDVSTGQAIRLAEHAAPYVDELPVWFPDGKRIAFQSDRTGRWEIWAMNADGSDVRQLTR
jgi:TolB protein